MICAHFGWTWDYLHKGISWNSVQKIMRDLPEYDNDEDDSGTGDIKEQTAAEFAAQMNNFSL